MTKLSICIANTNHSDMLDEALASIYRNPPSCDFEVLVVDNLSKDDSADMVRRKYPQVILSENKTRLGYPSNCNINMCQASGDYYLILNEDVEVQPGSLDTGIRYMDEHSDVGMLGCCMYLPNGNIQYTSGRRFPTLLSDVLGWTTLSERFPNSRFFGGYLMSYWQHDTIREVETVCEAGMLVRRSAVEQVGMMDENLFFCFDGPEWSQRFLRNSWKVLFHPGVRILHKEGQSSKPGGRPNYFILIESMRSSLYYYKKYHGAFYAFVYRYVMALVFALYSLKHSVALVKPRDDAARQSLQTRRETALVSFLWYWRGDRAVKRHFPIL